MVRGKGEGLRGEERRVDMIKKEYIFRGGYSESQSPRNTYSFGKVNQKSTGGEEKMEEKVIQENKS